jgi:predicted dehydrogenase
MGSALHAIDALRFLMGEVREFRGLGSAARYFDGKMVAASFALGFASGAAGTFTFNVRAGRSYERYRIFAENWTVNISQSSPGKFDESWWLEAEEGNRTVERIAGEDLTAERRCGQYAHGFWREHEYFAECLERNERPSPDVADGAVSMDLAQRMLESVAPDGQVARE